MVLLIVTAILSRCRVLLGGGIEEFILLPDGRDHSGTDALVSDAVDALNSLDAARAGRPLGLQRPMAPSFASAPASSRRVLGRLRRCAAEYAPPPAEVSRREALEDLLKCKDLYRIDESTTRVDMNLDWWKVVWAE